MVICPIALAVGCKEVPDICRVPGEGRHRRLQAGAAARSRRTGTDRGGQSRSRLARPSARARAAHAGSQRRSRRPAVLARDTCRCDCRRASGVHRVRAGGRRLGAASTARGVGASSRGRVGGLRGVKRDNLSADPTRKCVAATRGGRGLRRRLRRALRDPGHLSGRTHAGYSVDAGCRRHRGQSRRLRDRLAAEVRE